MNHWTPLHAQIHRTLKVRQLLPPHSRVLLAVSGGQDSLCLTKLLLDLQPKWDWQLAIAHCDHRWRPDSAANAEYVAQLANTWQIPFYLQVAQEIPKTEAAARQWRYQVLSNIATEHQFTHLLTGHTATDRAETLLYNLIRGAGGDGLQALTWKRPLPILEPIGSKINLVRPLLEVSRTQTGQFCQEHHLQIWEDSTNQDTSYTRNRIRLELMPILHSFNPQVEKHLNQTAELLQADGFYLEQQAIELLEKSLSQTDNNFNLETGKVAINRRILATASLAIQRRTLRQLLELVLPTAPNFQQIEKLIALIKAPNRSRTDPFVEGVLAEVAGDWIVLYRC